MKDKRVVCVIPARLQSQRFPKKVLSVLNGKPLLQHVWEAARACMQFDEVYFAIDSEETAKVIRGFKGKYQMTSKECSSGTYRIIEFMHLSKIKADIWVNWQADEPFIHKTMIESLLQGAHGDGMIWTLKKEIEKDLSDPNVVKVVTDHLGKALYFSRSQIPSNRKAKGGKLYKHIGIYAYSTEALKKIEKMPKSVLADMEGLEQLSFLEYGLPVYVYPTQHDTIGIDTMQDLIKASDLLGTVEI